MGVVTPSPAVRRGDVYLVALNPVRGREIQKTRPCAVVSPDELNAHLGTFLVVPLTTGTHRYPFRLPCRFAGKSGFLVVDQLRWSIASAWCVGSVGFRPGRSPRRCGCCRRCSRPEGGLA